MFAVVGSKGSDNVFDETMWPDQKEVLIEAYYEHAFGLGQNDDYKACDNGHSLVTLGNMTEVGDCLKAKCNKVK